MTGKEFIELVKQKGSFMRPEDLDSLISFYEARLRKASDPQEEEKLVEGFGDLDSVMNRVRSEYEKLRAETEENTAQAQSDENKHREDQKDKPPEQEKEFLGHKRSAKSTEKKDDDVKLFQSPPPPL